MRITQSRDLRQGKTDGAQEICGANSWFATNWLIGHFGKVMQDYLTGEVKKIAAAIRNCNPASVYGTMPAGVADCVSAAGAAWLCSGTAGCAAEEIMGSTGRVRVCTVAGSSRSFR